MQELSPKISLTESKILDRKSVRLIKSILEDQSVDDSQLEEGGNLPNIDGRIELLREDATMDAIVTVQIKHLTYSKVDNDTFYDIPQSLYAYAERSKGEVVLFLACDTDKGIVYWTHIDAAAVKDFKDCCDTHFQNTRRHHFRDFESFTYDNVENTLNVWRKLYNEKMESIKDERCLAQRFADIHLSAFKKLANEFHGLPGSHIKRDETDKIVSWVKAASTEKTNNLLLVTGNAGVGKSIVLKDLTDRLEQESIKTLCIKSDSIDTTGEKITVESILSAVSNLSAGQKTFVVIIDQIDALSQYLTNDRNRLNALLEAIATICGRTDVKVVVSCRKYDLEYDASLSRLKDKSETVELGELSDAQVYDVLDRLETGLKSKLSSRTTAIIRTAQYLDTFCFVYSRNRTRVNYDNPIELYDALWQLYIDEAPRKTGRKEIEHVLFTLARQMLASGTLSPSWTPAPEYEDACRYLCSSGAVRVNGNSMSFFHQTFYDYTLARCYVTENKSYIADLENRLQGLEIRSSVKSVLEYERGHSDSHYFSDLRLILTSPGIRLHLKLLAVSILAYSERPKPEEKRIFKQLCANNTRLPAYFLRGVRSEGWFAIARSIIRSIAGDMTADAELYYPAVRCLSAYSFKHPIEVFDIMNSIKDEKCRTGCIAFVLRNHNDYNAACVRSAYSGISPSNEHILYIYIKDAMTSNPQFAINETGKQIEQYLLSDLSKRRHDGYMLVNELCKHIAESRPKEFLTMVHSALVNAMKQKSFDSHPYHKYKSSAIFGYGMDNDTETLLDMYKTSLQEHSSDTGFIRPMVKELLALNEKTALSIAFEVMGHRSSCFHDDIKAIIADTDCAGDYMKGDVGYYFMEMVKQWYLSADKEDALWYERYVLKFESSEDTLFDKERRYGRPLMPFLWYDKWMLICNTLPEETHLPEMRRCRQELHRRFRHKCIKSRPNHHVACASICGGLVTDDIYRRFSEKAWLNSFLKLKEHRHRFHDNRDIIDLRVHAKAFGKCVAADTGIFKPFVFGLFAREDISTMYKVAGLKGLLDGGVDIETAWPLFRQLCDVDFVKTDPHTYKELASYFLRHENGHIDELTAFLVELVKLPYGKSDRLGTETSKEEKCEYKATEMLNRGINSPQRIALKAIISLCVIKDRRAPTYSLLTGLCSNIDNDLKAVVLQYLYTKEHFDESFFFPLMKTYIDSMGTECLAILPGAIQYCYYYKREFVEDYMNRIEEDDRSHEILAQIYFFGTGVKGIGEECTQRLNFIMNMNNENVVAKIVELSLKNFSDTELNECSTNIIRQFATDDRKKVRNSYLLHCDELPVEAFPLFYRISETWYTDKRRNICYELKYVSKCISTFPCECLDFIKKHDFSHPDYQRYVDDDIVKILLQIYRKLNEEADEKAMNDLMDLFDEYLYKDNSVINKAIEDMMK